MESKELHSSDANEEHTTFTNGSSEVIHQIAYWCFHLHVPSRH